MPTYTETETQGSFKHSQDLLSQFTHSTTEEPITVANSYAERTQWLQDTAPCSDPHKDYIVEDT